MQLILWAVIAAAAVILDQLTKSLAVRDLKPIGSTVVIDRILGLRYVENRGAAFGMMQGFRWVFIVLSFAAIAAIAVLLVWKRKRVPPLLGIGLAMIVGGGIGNQIDRLVSGYVVDFFEFLFVDFAIFNVADTFVTVGAVLVLVDLLFFHRDFLTEKPGKIPDKPLPGSGERDP